MKKIFKTFIILIALILVVGCRNNKLEGGDDNLVTFNDNKLNITNNDLYNVLKEKYGTSLLIDLIDEKILNQEYEDTNEIDDYANIQVTSLKNYYEKESEFLEYINNYGYQNEEELKDYFKLNYKRNLAVYDYLESIITLDDINNYYDNKINGDVTLSHILIEVKTTSTMTEDEKRTTKEEALKKAQEAIQKLKDGTSFQDVAKEYSTDTATNTNGGKMGVINLLDTDDVTRQEVTKLKVGSYSTEPIETEYGYEIFYKEKEDTKPALEDVKSKIIKIMSNEKLTASETLQYKGIQALREKYGFKIKDDDLAVYYENTMNNLLSGE